MSTMTRRVACGQDLRHVGSKGENSAGPHLRFERGLASSLAVRDFTQIIDAYAEFSESVISALVEAIDEEDEDKGRNRAGSRMRAFGDLMDRRPFLLNDVLFRRNPNDAQEWEKGVAHLGGENDGKGGFK